MPEKSSEDVALEQVFALLATGRPADRDAAVRLADRTLGRKLERYFLRHKVQENDAEELVWDVWHKMLQSNFRGETRPVVWVWIIARSLLLSYIRIKNGDHEFTLDDDQWEQIINSLQAPNVPAWIRICIERALFRFEQDHPERMEILRMLAEDWSAKEIGDYYGCSEGAARDRVYRTRALVRQYLEECKEGLA